MGRPWRQVGRPIRPSPRGTGEIEMWPMWLIGYVLVVVGIMGTMYLNGPRR